MQKAGNVGTADLWINGVTKTTEYDNGNAVAANTYITEVRFNQLRLVMPSNLVDFWLTEYLLLLKKLSK